MIGERVARKPQTGKPYKFNTLNIYLRKGLSPVQLGGIKLGEGVCKAAYKFDIIDRMTGRITPYVIKENAQGGFAGDSKKFPDDIIHAGGRAPKTTRIGNYIMQEYATPFKTMRYADMNNHPAYVQYQKINDRLAAMGKFYDLHIGNAGYNCDGELVIFDW